MKSKLLAKESNHNHKANKDINYKYINNNSSKKKGLNGAATVFSGQPKLVRSSPTTDQSSTPLTLRVKGTPPQLQDYRQDVGKVVVDASPVAHLPHRNSFIL